MKEKVPRIGNSLIFNQQKIKAKFRVSRAAVEQSHTETLGCYLAPCLKSAWPDALNVRPWSDLRRMCKLLHISTLSCFHGLFELKK